MKPLTPKDALIHLLGVIESHEITGEDCDRRGAMVCSCWTKAVDAAKQSVETKLIETKFRFPNVFCSQCGRKFGPGNHGFSHCGNHKPNCGNCAFRVEIDRSDQVQCGNLKSPEEGANKEITDYCKDFKLDTF